jgi:hypothetical protein
MDFDRITHPLRLASGSHLPGSGKGCAMNVIADERLVRPLLRGVTTPRKKFTSATRRPETNRGPAQRTARPHQAHGQH